MLIHINYGDTTCDCVYDGWDTHTVTQAYCEVIRVETGKTYFRTILILDHTDHHSIIINISYIVL